MTVPWVPTGMKTGVSTVPLDVTILPLLAFPSLAFRSNLNMVRLFYYVRRGGP